MITQYLQKKRKFCLVFKPLVRVNFCKLIEKCLIIKLLLSSGFAKYLELSNLASVLFG